jgi:hypothetical protein
VIRPVFLDRAERKAELAACTFLRGRFVNPATETERPNALDRVLQREWGLALA